MLRFLPTRVLVAVTVVLLFAPAIAHAQADEEEDPRGTAPPTASSPNEVVQPGEATREDDMTLEEATPDPTPPVPRPLQRDDGPTVDVIEQAGVGGPTAFASAGVLEVGGYGSVLAGEDFVMTKVAPFVGLFVWDGLELTLSQEIYGGSVGDSGLSFSMLALLEVSGHLAFSDRLLGFLGAAPGFLYNGTDAAFALKPRLGLDVLIGRSGIFRPAVFLIWATAPVLDLAGRATQGSSLAYGLEIAYSVMF